mgnify:CR=1 FL=1
MRQRLSRARRVLREKYPRTHKIIDKTTDMVGWTPIILMIYSQVILMTYSLYKSEGNDRDK